MSTTTPDAAVDRVIERATEKAVERAQQKSTISLREVADLFHVSRVSILNWPKSVHCQPIQGRRRLMYFQRARFDHFARGWATWLGRPARWPRDSRDTPGR
jgi:hypothetical protein